MHICMMRIPMILDPDACVYDAGMNDAYIRSLTLMHVMRDFLVSDQRTDKPILGVGWVLILMHVCMMQTYVSKILYPDTCIHDAGFFPDGRTNERTDKPILGVGYLYLTDFFQGKIWKCTPNNIMNHELWYNRLNFISIILIIVNLEHYLVRLKTYKLWIMIITQKFKSKIDL